MPQPHQRHHTNHAEPAEPAGTDLLGDVGDIDDIDDIDVIAGDPPVPITVWPVASADHRTGRTPPPRGGDTASMSPPLADRVVHTYTRRGDAVGFDRDANLRAAAHAAGCRYRRLRHLSHLGDLRAVTGHAGLVVLRWPRLAKTARPAEQVEQLFTACRSLLAPGGYTVAVLAPPSAPSELARAAELVPAAHRCGLGYLQHIVAVTAIDEDRLTIPDPPPAVGHLRVHSDLLVLVLRAGRHG
jgi:hypothetical protein